MLTLRAENVWPLLNGIICVYKPQGVSCQFVKCKLKEFICKDLNNMIVREPMNYIEVNHSRSEIELRVRKSYADNVLCVGPRYQPEDIRIDFPSKLSKFMSGVLIVGINEGANFSNVLRKNMLTKCFHVKGILGQASNDFLSESKIIGRSKYDHVKMYYIDKTLASYQSVNQRRMFEEYGVSMNSQEAYDLAVSGLFRPMNKGATIIYSLKSINLVPPDFTIEVQCINETEDYLKNLIHNLGVSLKALATCSSMRCIRQGCFHVEHSLLKKDWNVKNIVNNIRTCRSVLKKVFPDQILFEPTVYASTDTDIHFPVEEEIEVKEDEKDLNIETKSSKL